MAAPIVTTCGVCAAMAVARQCDPRDGVLAENVAQHACEVLLLGIMWTSARNVVEQLCDLHGHRLALATALHRVQHGPPKPGAAS